MIRPINVTINAANPELPLAEATAFVGAPSAVFVRGVPKGCGNWRITAVSVAVTYPDNATTTRAAVESAEGVWVATIPGTLTTGRTAAGFRILADGIDENGAAATGYVLGWADFSVFSLLPVPAPGGTFYYLRIFDAMPTSPRKGDACEIDGIIKWYNGTAWVPFGGDMSHYQFASLPVENLNPEDVGLPEICDLLNTMKNLLRPAALAILAAFAIVAPSTSTAASVETDKLVNLKGSSNVVTRVDLSGLATTSTVASATNALDVSLSSRLSQSSRASTNYTDRATNELVRALTEGDLYATYAREAELGEKAWGLVENKPPDQHPKYRDATDIFAQLDAATETNAAQSAAIETRTTLSPVYSQTPAWAYEGLPEGATPSGYMPPVYESTHGFWMFGFFYGGEEYYSEVSGDGTETRLVFTAARIHPGEQPPPLMFSGIVAYRTDIVGYTLGSQTNKVLAATNATAYATPQAVTNIVRDLSLGGIWDSQLEVWWTPRMRNGSLTYEATTNVNLNAEN